MFKLLSFYCGMNWNDFDFRHFCGFLRVLTQSTPLIHCLVMFQRKML